MTGLSDLSIRNRVFAVMLSAAMLVFGYLGYRELGISQFPEIDFPVVSITTYREASDPEPMDFDVTDFIEDAVSGVEGIDYITSQSTAGSAVTTVFFHLHRDVDVAMQDVQNAVSAARARLPVDIDPPIISKVNFNKFPVLWLAVYGNRPLQEINRIVSDHLKQHIETIPGCGGVMYGGLRERNLRIWLDNDRLRSFNLDAQDVFLALPREHMERPAGYLQSLDREMNVRVMGESRRPEEFARLPVVNRNGQIVRLGDVAVIEDGLADRRALARFNRSPTVGIGVMRAKGANVVGVCDEVKRRLPDLQRRLKALSPELEIGISTDYSLFIKDDIDEVKLSLVLGVALTALVAFLFLGSLGTTFNVCLAIPTSLVGTFIVMKWFGFTINFMTLLALSLSVGVVVDDAILVLENIYRRREEGEGRWEAAWYGAREITFAALAATFSIAAIFIPVAFMKGSIGAFFFQFGITCTVAVLLSLVIALSITPMLCSVSLNVRRMRRPCPPPWGGLLGPVVTVCSRLFWLLDRWVLELLFVRPMNALMQGCSWAYAGALRFCLRHPRPVLTVSLLLATVPLVLIWGITIPLPGPLANWAGKPAWVIKPIGRELVPSEDQNRFVVNVICPVGTGIDYIDSMLGKTEEVLANLKDPVTGGDLIASMFAAVSIRPGTLVSEGICFVRLVPAHERTLTQDQVIAEVRKRLMKIPGMRGIALDLSTQGFTATRGYPVNFAVQGPQWETVTRLAETIRQRMIDARSEAGTPVLTDVNTDYRPGMPEVRVRPDRDKCAALGVSIERVAYTINVAFGGVRQGRFTDLDKRYDVRLRLLEPQRQCPDQLQDLYVKSRAGKLVALADLVAVSEHSTLPQLFRYNHLRKVEMTANMGPGISQGEAIAQARAIAEEVREEMGLPESYRIVPLGNAQAMAQTLESMWAALTLGFVVAYMILGVQFNSFVHPFTVLLAVPFGVTGALLMLWWAGDTLNLMSMIGLVLLAGLVKKNSIILVDYTNQLREHGLPLEQAVQTACPVRLRPIIMTSLATIAAAIPLAMGYGPGAETRAPLARSIIGGIFLSTLVTLILVPVFYIELDKLGQWVRRLSRRGPQQQEPPAFESQPLPAREPAAPQPSERQLEPVSEAQPLPQPAPGG